MSSAPPDRNVPPSAPGWRKRGMLLVLAGLAVLAAGFGIATRVRGRKVLREDTEAAAAPLVSLIAAERGTAQQELVLPGTAQAFTDAPIYARTSGYLRKWYADIGTRVRKGQLLAEIDSPETDQQLLQARAELGTARANERLARVTADRYTELVKSDSVSKQDVDNAVETLAARRADVASAEANVRRLEQLVSFERIEAPFDGVITARNTDIGQLVDAGAGGGTSRELFHIATTGTLRVFVAVPQTASPSATPGVPVDVTLIERPGKAFPGKIVRNSRAIDPATRTLLVEIDLDNKDGEILPGAAVEAHLKLTAANTTWLLPVSALMFRSEGIRVAVLAQGGHASLLPVTLGRDLGTKIEITSGLPSSAQVINNPPDSLVDGQAVRIAKPAAAQPAQKKD